jgi:hypothetical protein
MKITYKDLYELTKDKQIIGIGENTHGSHCFWNYRRKLIELLRTKNAVIALEENDHFLHHSPENRFPMHQTKVFKDFQSHMEKLKIPIIGIDNYTGTSSNIRNRRMAEEILKLTKKYDKIFFLAFNSHISTFSAPKEFNLDFRGYDSKHDVGHYLKSYFNIGLILLKGKTKGKQLGEYDERIFDFKNLPDIMKLHSGIYWQHENYKYSGMGPFLYENYETRWHDAFIIIPDCKKPAL